MKRFQFHYWAFVFLLLRSPLGAVEAETARVQGRVEYRRDASASWETLRKNNALHAGDRIRSAESGVLEIIVGKINRVTLGESSVLDALASPLAGRFALRAGKMRALARETLEIETEFVRVYLDDAVAGVAYDPADRTTRIAVFSGTVIISSLENPRLTMRASANTTVAIVGGNLPGTSRRYDASTDALFWQFKGDALSAAPESIDRNKRW